MKHLLLIPLILSAFFLSAGIASSGGNDCSSEHVLEIDEADTAPSDFMPLSTSELDSAKGFSFYIQDSWAVTNGLTLNFGTRLEWHDLFHEKLQEVSTNYETVVADDNQDWMAGVGDYMEGALKESIPEIERAIERRSSVRPKINSQIRDLSKPALELYLEAHRDNLTMGEIDYIVRMIIGEEEYRKQHEFLIKTMVDSIEGMGGDVSPYVWR